MVLCLFVWCCCRVWLVVCVGMLVCCCCMLFVFGWMLGCGCDWRLSMVLCVSELDWLVICRGCWFVVGVVLCVMLCWLVGGDVLAVCF